MRPAERGEDAGTPGAPAADEPWTVLRMVRWSADYLEGKGVDAAQARLDGEHLLAHALGTTRLQLYLQFDRPLTPDELGEYKPLLVRRARREPLQYILGRAAFRELDLRVDPRVLIPRPETEELVEAVLEWARSRAGNGRRPAANGDAAPAVEKTSLPWSSSEGPGAGDAAAPSGSAGTAPPTGPPGPSPDHRVLSALDVGTGSGCIALSLAREGPFRRVVATDLEADVLALAGENAREAGLEDRVELRRGALWQPVTGERFDVVVANPPYVARADAGGLEPEVGEHEPEAALFAGADGMDVLAPLVAGAPEHVAPGGLLALEVGLGQAEAVADRIRATGAFDDPRVRRDLAGRPRIVLAERRSD